MEPALHGLPGHLPTKRCWSGPSVPGPATAPGNRHRSSRPGRPHRISEVKSPSRRTCAAPPQKAGFSEIASAQTLWSNDLATNRQPVRHEVVTHVLGTFCYTCLRARQIDSGERGETRTLDPMIKSYDLAHILTPVRIQFSDDSTRSAHFIGLTRDIFQQRAIITNQLCSPCLCAYSVHIDPITIFSVHGKRREP